MTDPTIRQLWNSGGCRWAHVLYVCGYPWAVCSDDALVSMLDNPESDTDAAYLREEMFGKASWATNTPAYNVQVFPTLRKQSLGNIKVSVQEGRGLPRIGTLRLQILDDDTGTTWDHSPDGDTLYGLEGVHRVSDITHSSTVGWGYLEDNLPASESAIDIIEESGSRLKSRIDALTGDQYVVLWVGHEAIAVTSTTGSGDAYQINVATEGRGIYKTRAQDHYTPILSDVRHVISDVPGSIAGHFCLLYCIPLDNDGNFYHDTSGNPVVGIEYQGIVAPNVSTKDRVTTIQINPATAALETDVDLKRASRSICHLANYVFCRGDSGTTFDGIMPYWQCPHLLIAELKSGGDPDVDEDWIRRAVWICRQGETRVFESIFEVADALKTELQLCADYSDEQRSGYGTSGVNQKTQITWPLTIEIIDGLPAIILDDATTFPDLKTRIIGPLVTVLGLGIYPSSLYPDGYTSAWEMIKNRDTSSFELIGGKLMEGTFSSPDESRFWREVNIKGVGTWTKEYAMFPMFYYQWDWVNFPPEEFTLDDWSAWSNNVNPPGSTNFFPPYCDFEDVAKLYLRHDTDTSVLIASEVVDIGNIYTLTVNSLDDSDYYNTPELTTSGAIATKDDYETWYGNSIIYIPYAEVIGKILNAPDERREIIDSIDVFELDPYTISKHADLLTTDLSSIYREFLGEGVSSLYIPRESRLTHIPFFTDTDDFVSIIDWDSFSDAMQPYGDWHYYVIDGNKPINLLRTLDTEIVFHMAMPTYEWDDANNMFRIRFRKLGPASYAAAKLSGKHLSQSGHISGDPRELHSDQRLYNKVEFNLPTRYIPPSSWLPEFEADNERQKFTIRNNTSTCPVHTDVTTLKIEPYFSRANYGIFAEVAGPMWYDILYFLSSPQITQEVGVTPKGRMVAEAGTESLMSHDTASVPLTHTRGFANEPIFITGVEFGVWPGKGKVTYRIGNRDGWEYGVAPACVLESGNYTLHGTYLTGTPNDHEYSAETSPKDVYYFDCFDLADKSNPTARTSCGCSDYAVIVVQKGDQTFTPITGTCSVTNGTLRVDCTTATIDSGEDIAVYYQKFDNLQTCQKDWIFFADSDGTVGTINRPASRWSL